MLMRHVREEHILDEIGLAFAIRCSFPPIWQRDVGAWNAPNPVVHRRQPGRSLIDVTANDTNTTPLIRFNDLSSTCSRLWCR